MYLVCSTLQEPVHMIDTPQSTSGCDTMTLQFGQAVKTGLSFDYSGTVESSLSKQAGGYNLCSPDPAASFPLGLLKLLPTLPEVECSSWCNSNRYNISVYYICTFHV